MKKPRYGDKHTETEGPIRLYEKAIPNKRAPSYWVVQLEWRDPGEPKKRCYDSAENWPQAKELAKKKRRQLEDQEQLAAGSSVSFRKAWEKYVAKCQERLTLNMGMTAGSLRNIRFAGERFLIPRFGSKAVDKITAVQIEDWLMELGAKHGISDNVRRGLYSMMRPFFDFAKKRGWVTHNALKVDPIKFAAPQKRVAIPSWDDVERHGEFLCGPRPSLTGFGVASTFDSFAWAKRRIVYALGAFAGLRAGEISALRWERVNLVRAFLEVDEKEGGNTRWAGIGKPKTKNAARIIPMCQYLYDELMWYGDFVTGKGRPPDAGFVVFPRIGDRGSKPLDPVVISCDLHSGGLVLAGIVGPDGKRKYSQHAYRHFFCSALLLLGTVPEVVAKRAGHANGAFTSQTYAHVLRTDEEGYIDEVPNEAIWRTRFARAKPPAPLVQIGDDGKVIDAEPDAVLLSDLRYRAAGGRDLPAMFRLSGPRGLPPRHGGRGSHKRPYHVPEWVHEALALIDAGWHLPDLVKRLGKNPNTVSRAFQQAGLPSPHQCVIRVREARFRELVDMGYPSLDIARIMSVSTQAVSEWRRANGLQGDANPLINKKKPTPAPPSDATDLRRDQLKLL